MSRRTSGWLYQTGKDKHYAFRYRVDQKAYKQVLVDDKGHYIYDEKVAQKAADKILAPLQLQDDVDRAQLLQARLDKAKQAVAEAEEQKRNDACLISDGWKKFMECPDRPQCCQGYSAGDHLPDHSNVGNYRSYYTRFQQWCGKNLKDKTSLAELLPADATRFVNYLQKTEKMSAGTVGKYITFLKMLYDLLIDNEIISCKNPFKKIRKPTNAVNRRDMLTTEEVATIIDHAEGDYKILIMLTVCTGMRLGDCCLLTWDKIDFNTGMLRYIPHKTEHTRKDSSLAMSSVSLPSALVEWLRPMKETAESEYVFPHIAGHYQSNMVNRAINRLFDECGIVRHREGTGPGTGKRAVVKKSHHSLRHWFASFCGEQGIPIQTVRGILGHTSSATPSYYTHTTDTALARVRTVMEDVVPEKADILPLPERSGTKEDQDLVQQELF